MARSFAYDRFFGEDIPQELQNKLEARQALQRSSKFGDPIDGNTHPYKSINKSNFDGGVNDFSSRKTWARMWVAIQNYSLNPPMAELQEKAKTDPTAYSSDISVNSVKIYSIGDNIYHDYVQQTDYTDTNTNKLLKGSTNPYDDNKQGDWLAQNKMLKPGAGITNIEMNTAGYLGAIKETVVQFKVYNFYDYENIVVPYFLVPGAKVFVDFGWDTSDIYDPKDLISGTGNDQNFVFKDFYEKIYGVDGLMHSSQGDLEVLAGAVTKFDAKANPDGSFSCTVTFTSTNYALVDYDEATGIPINQAIQNAVTTALYDRMANDYKQQENAEFDYLNKNSVLGNQYVRETLPVYVGTQKRSRLFGGGKGGPVRASTIPAISYQTGLYYQLLDDKHQFKNLDTNAKFQTYMKSGNSEMYITFKRLGEILTQLTGAEYEGFDDANAKFDFSGERVTYDEFLMARQSMNSGELYQVLDFLYPTDPAFVKLFRVTDDGAESAQGGGSGDGTVCDNEWGGAGYSCMDVNTRVQGNGGCKSGKCPGDASNMCCPGGVRNFETDGWDIAYCDMDYLFIRYELVIDAFSKQKNIKDAIAQILNKLNDEGLGVFNLKVTPSATDNQLVITDVNYRQAISRLGDNPDDNVGEGEGDSQDNETKVSDSENIFMFRAMSPNTIMSSVDLTMTLANNALASRLAIQGMSADRILYPVTAQTELDIALKGQNQSSPGAGDEAETTSNPDTNQYYTHVPLVLKESSDRLMRNTIDIYVNPSYPKPDASPTKNKEKEMLKNGLFELYSKGMTMIPGQNSANTSWEGSGKEWEKYMLPPDLNLIPTKDVQKTEPDYTDPEMVGAFPNPVYLDDVDNYFKLRLTNSKIDSKVQDVILPYTLSFQIYGIAGLQPGNRFTIDYIPARQRATSFFIIKKIQQSVNNSKWITKVEAQMHLKGDKALKNVVSYRPTVHLSTKQMVNLGYTKPQIDKIREDDLNWWSIQPEMLKTAGCNDVNALNYTGTTKLDCDGEQDGNACWCCEYCVSYDYADYALDKKTTGPVTGNDIYGTHMGSEKGDWGCNHGKINGLDVVFDEEELKIGNRICSYPPNEEEQNAIFNPVVEDEELGADYVEKVQTVVQTECKRPCCTETKKYCESIDAWRDKVMKNVCKEQSTFHYILNIDPKTCADQQPYKKQYWCSDEYGPKGYKPTDPPENSVNGKVRNECQYIYQDKLCWVDYTRVDECEADLEYCDQSC